MIPKVTFKIDDPHPPFVRIFVGDRTLGCIEAWRRWNRGQMEVWSSPCGLGAQIDR